MKTYEAPTIELVALSLDDVIATSTLIIEVEDDDILL